MLLCNTHTTKFPPLQASMKAEKAECYHKESFREIGLWFKSLINATARAYNAHHL